MASSSTDAPPLVARSPDGSLIAVHHPAQASSNSDAGSIRCYDGDVSNGSLKFTLRVPLHDDDNATENVLSKLAFAANRDDGRPSHLCGALESPSSSILVWDLDRGVHATTIDVRDANAKSPSKKKKKEGRKSSSSNGNEVLCDVAAVGDRLYALVFLPNDDGGSDGKCRVYQYDLSLDGAPLARKIKVGSSISDGVPASSFGIAVSETTVAVRMGDHLRVLDSNAGDKLCKIDLPDIILSSSAEGDQDARTVMETSRDGRHVVLSVGNRAALFDRGGGGANNGDKKRKPRTAALLSVAGDDGCSPISNLDLASDGKGGAVCLAFQSAAGVASLFSISASAKSSSSAPRMPTAEFRTDDGESKVSLVHADFRPRRPDQEVRLLFKLSKQKGGSAAGSGTHLPMESVKYGGIEGTTVVGASLASAEDGEGGGRKRKNADSLALAPGDTGREASTATDLTLGTKKKKRKAGVEEDDDDDDAEGEDEFNLEEDGGEGQTIAERLAMLSSAMEQTDDEDDDDDSDDNDEGEKPRAKGGGKFNPKSATPQTLSALLTQALSSGDAARLDTALQVTDRRLVEDTVRALQAMDAERDVDGAAPAYLPALVAHVARKMARRHSLVAPLGVWLRAVLAATARGCMTVAMRGEGTGEAEERTAREGREMAARLGPLRNFLNERAESFPQLLRLEGRLALLNQQF